MKNFNIKMGNMKAAQQFTLYPYDGGDIIYLQSDKRFAIMNLRTGNGYMNATNCNYPNSVKLAANPITCQLPDETKIAIQKWLWENDGKGGNIGGVVYYDNRQLFSQ